MLRLDTWKSCTLEDIDHKWSNTYYVSSDLLYGMVNSEKGGNGPATVAAYEAYLHQNVVHYPFMTAYDIDGDLTNGISMWVHDGLYQGYWDHPGGMAPWDIVKRAGMWPLTGRPRQMYYRASLGMNDITYSDTGHLCLTNLPGWHAGFLDTVAHWFAVWPQNLWYVRQNTRGPGSVVYSNPKKWAVTGASELHAIDRAQATYMGDGVGVFEEVWAAVAEIAHQWGIWWPVQFYHAEPVYGHIYFLPARAAIAACKTATGKVKDYFNGSSEGGSGKANIARYPPLSEDIASTAGTVETSLSNMLDTLDEIEWTGDPANLHCSDIDYHKIMQAVWDACKITAWLPSCDYRTPLKDSST